MKKFFVSLAMLALCIAFMPKAHALTIDDVLKDISSIQNRLVQMRTQLGAAAILSTKSVDNIRDVKTNIELTPETVVKPVDSSVPVVYPKVETPVITTTTSQPKTEVVAIATAPTQEAGFVRELTVGMKGDDVARLQIFLSEKGYFTATPTGTFGPVTLGAVKKYQLAIGLSGTGYVGPKTLATLNKTIGVVTTADKPIPGTGGVNDCVVNSFTATPNPTTVGTAVTISWSTTNCTNAAITNVATNYVYAIPTGSVGSGSVTRIFSTAGTYAFGIRASGNDTLAGKSVSIVVNPADPWVALCADGQPHIQVLSPNGGETYTAGQQVTVKWKSCGAPTSMFVSGGLTDMINGLDHQISFVNNINNNASNTQNDGVDDITILDQTRIVSGKRYKLTLELFTSNGPLGGGDVSDDLFTVNGSITTVYACNDGIDNDNDGFVDMNDPGCASATDNDEYNVITSTLPILLTPLDNKIYFQSNPYSKASVVFNHLFKLKNTSTEPVWVKCGMIFDDLLPHTYPTPVTGGFSGSCTSSVNIEEYTQINPGQEILVNKSSLFQINGPDHFTLNMSATINKLKYKNISGQELEEIPQNHPQFQSTWSLTTPTITVPF